VKPKLEALKEKHKGDSRKFAEAQMRLFKEEKVPLVPIGGCLPIFLQIPVFFGLFAALRASIDLRQASWLWVADLSQPDHFIRFDNPVYNPMSFCSGCCGTPAPDITGLHILPILMTVAWVLNSYLMPRPETTNPQMEQQRKMMMFMPLLFGLMMYSYAAGLSLYWLTSSVVGIIETRIIKKVWPLKKA
jgi:YidC/Oxa1 family membrane protein insertase